MWSLFSHASLFQGMLSSGVSLHPEDLLDLPSNKLGVGIINSTTNESLVEAQSINTTTGKQGAHDGSLRLSTLTNSTQQRVLDKKIFVAVVVCTRSTKSWRSISQTSLHTLLLPSIEKTISSDEWSTFRVEVIVAFDKGDAFWENAAHREGLVKDLHIPVSFVSIPKKTDRKRIPFNEACRSAYDYGADYIVRVNDDTQFITNGWITKGVRTLQAYEPANVGVAGPTCRQGNTRILTHDMVHRTHMEIFADYYPPEFDNWWIDDWITLVYGSNHTTKLRDWEVRHHTDKHGTRYSPDHRQAKLLEPALDRGSKRIQHYFDTGAKDPNITSVLWTGELEVVAGPMQNVQLTNSNDSLVEEAQLMNTTRTQGLHDGLLFSTLTNSTQQGVLDKNLFVARTNSKHQAEARRRLKYNQKQYVKKVNKDRQRHHLR
jgi:hypothetical protein